MADAAVRTAVATDVEEITRIQATTWRVAYAELLGEDILARLTDPDAASAWRAAILDGPASVYLATEGAWTVGFCAAGPAPDAEVANADGTLPADAATVGLISTLLVEPRWGRRGHGGRLLATAARDLRERGAARGICWVLDRDQASINFYARAGWLPDGTARTLADGNRIIREIRLTGTLELAMV
jgi:GNAT superfamily N-acetyltransferase